MIENPYYTIYDTYSTTRDALVGVREGLTASSKPYNDQWIWDPLSKEFIAQFTYDLKTLYISYMESQSTCEGYASRKEFAVKEKERLNDSLQENGSYLPKIYEYESDLLDKKRLNRAVQYNGSFMPQIK